MNLFHSDRDRSLSIAQIDRDLARFRRDAEPSARTGPAAVVEWWKGEVEPLLSEWAQFKDAEMRSWITRAATTWETYKNWARRLQEARSTARALGVHLSGPEPAGLPQTLFETAESGIGSPGDAEWTVGRNLLYTAIAAAGIAAFVRGGS